MNSILDLSAFAVAGGVLAYQLICLQSEQRELREAINERLGSLTPSLPVLGVETMNDLKASIASAVVESLAAVAPIAPAQEPAATAPAAAAGVPDETTPAEARKGLQAELEAMTADQIRAQIRKLPEGKRLVFRSMGISIDKGRKADLIKGLLKALV
jgi:hypothetical protein